MPHVLIETRWKYSEAEEVALVDAVHGALEQAFRIPPSDRHVRLLAHEPHRFGCPHRIPEPDRCTLVKIDAFAGRSTDAKRDLYRQIVERLEPLGVAREQISIVIQDIPLTNWGIRGGSAACDVDLGFDINV